MILCCGEALIDMLPRRTDAGEEAFAPYPGGAVFNTAIALGRLEGDVGFFCGLSSDLFGDILRGSLAEAQVDSSLSPSLDRPTTLAFVKLVEGHATYHFYDENSALVSLTEADLPEMTDNIDALFFGGISLASDPCGGAFEALMHREAPARVTMIDPNIRPGFIKDRAAYVARIRAMMALADIVKLSDEDLAWLEGEGSPEDLARALIARGTKIVLITMGAEGAWAFTAQGKSFVPSKKVSVVDTVGAGDTFNAGVLASLSDQGLLSKAALAEIAHEALDKALAMGAACAAVTVSRAGANPPRRSEL